MNTTMVSVIVPVFNVEKYLIRCIESLINQNYKEKYEIILVNDGSTDKSGEICERYSKQYNNVFCFNKRNGGLSSARNYGLVFARGGWITFVDSDDYVSESYIYDLVRVRDKFQADIVLTRVVLMTEEEAKCEHKEILNEHYVDSDTGFINVYIQKLVSWSACGKLFKKDIFHKHSFPLGYYEDSASMYLFLSECEKVAIADLINNYHYIRREGSITSSYLSKKHMRIFEVTEEICKFIEDKFPEKKYYQALIYQNSVLQLITRVDMNDKDFKLIFARSAILIRKDILKIISDKAIPLKIKYYSVIMSTTPRIFKMQREIFKMFGLINKWV